MLWNSDKPVPANYFLEPGYILIATKPHIISGVLGSGVSVSLYDKKRKVGGMNHFRYPFIEDKDSATAIYGNAATLALIYLMINDGSNIKHLEAQIFGGAFNPEISDTNVGRENILAAKKILSKKQIKLVSEDIGGEKGRKIVFNTNTNEIAVMKVERLRAGDWYPYEDNR